MKKYPKLNNNNEYLVKIIIEGLKFLCACFWSKNILVIMNMKELGKNLLERKKNKFFQKMFQNFKKLNYQFYVIIKNALKLYKKENIMIVGLLA